MDFSKFRGSGDLSDITVTIQGNEHKLHKFPFYARSDYFCELARSKPEGESEHVHLELDDFPGGDETFEKVADFCYNMPLEITKANVVALRCAAEYLKMYGPNNLTERTDKYLSSTVASAKLVKATTAITGLLTDCNAIGELAQRAGIVDTLAEALVDCWRKTVGSVGVSNKGATESKAQLQPSSVGSAFTRVSAVMVQSKSTDRLDQFSLEALTVLRAEWVANILSKARDADISYEALGGLAVKYISNALGIVNNDSNTTSVSHVSEDGPSEVNEESSDSTPQNQTSGNDSVQTSKERTKTVAVEGSESGKTLDMIVLALPEQAFNIPAVTMDWLTKVLRVATSQKCACRGHLVRVAGEMLTRLDPDDLCVISPSVLHDIVTDHDQTGDDQEHQENVPQIAKDDANEKENHEISGEAAEVDDKPVGSGTISGTSSAVATGLTGDKACHLVDTYMGQMMEKESLTSETFKLLTIATKRYARPSHDSLFEQLLFVIKAEKESLTEEAKSDLTDLINFDLLTETSLRKALEDGVIPVQKVAESALRLSSRLRSELESVKYIVDMQEEDIQKYQGSGSSKLKTSDVHSRYSGRASPPCISDNKHSSTTFSDRARLINSGYSDDQDCETESRTHLDLDALRSEDLDSLEPLHTSHATSEHLRAAQGVLNAARHKLATPMYTGYRPARLSSPPTLLAHTTPRSYRGLEHDITLEEELDFRYDRTFRSLDPRVRHQRMGGHSSQNVSHRTYFPYSNHRF